MIIILPTMEREPIPTGCHPEIQTIPEVPESPDKLACLLRKGQISIHEYLRLIRINAERLNPNEDVDISLSRNERKLWNKHDYGYDYTVGKVDRLEREATADYLTRKISLSQYRFLMDRYSIFTHLDLVGLAEEFNEREARYKREAFIKKVKTGIIRMFRSTNPSI